MRHFFDKFGGNLGTSGCVMFMFDQKGVLIIESSGQVDEEKDIEAQEEYYMITTKPSDFSQARDALESLGYSFAEAQVQYVPQTEVHLDSEKDIAQMGKLIDNLEDCDDVQAVWHNWEGEE